MKKLLRKTLRRGDVNKSKNGSIKRKLIPLMIIAIILPILILSVVNYSISNKVLLDNFKSNSAEMTMQVNNNIDSMFNEMESTVNFLAKEENFKNLVLFEEGKAENENATEKEARYFGGITLDNIVDTKENVFSAYIGTRNKTFFADSSNASANNADYDPTQRPWYKKAMENPDQIIYTEPYESASTGKLMVTVAKTLKGGGEVLGVLGIDVTLDDLASQYKDVKMGDSGRLYVLSPEGMVLVHPDTQLIGQSLKDQEIFEVFNSSKEGFKEYSFEGEDNYVSFATNDKTSWKIGLRFSTNETQQSLNTIIQTNLFIALVCIIVGMLFALYLSKIITKPLKILEEGINKAASGDLSEEITIDSNDEFGMIGTHFNQMIEHLKELIGDIISSAKVVTESSTSLKDISSQTSTATSEVATTIEEIAQTASSEAMQTERGMNKSEQLSKSIDEISKAIHTVEEVYDKVTTLNTNGIKEMEDLTDKTSQVHSEAENLNEVIVAMDTSSQKIGEIIETIKSIAEQTNLLALNASIESARAGEAGRGFAVVAEEIRKLSEDTSYSVEEINKLIMEIQNRSSNAVSSINTTQNTLGKQIHAVNETKETFEKMYQAIVDVSSHINHIGEMNKTMTENKEEITYAMTEISGAAEETSASTEEVSASTEEILASIEQLSASTTQLSELAQNLLKKVENFKLQ